MLNRAYYGVFNVADFGGFVKKTEILVDVSLPGEKTVKN
jgi:hypothetical protein